MTFRIQTIKAINTLYGKDLFKSIAEDMKRKILTWKTESKEMWTVRNQNYGDACKKKAATQRHYNV